jgi:hypothetical protein
LKLLRSLIATMSTVKMAYISLVEDLGNRI